MPNRKDDIEYRLLDEAELPDGRQVKFFLSPNMEKANRGYVADEITAWDGEDLLGYLRASYIGKDEFKKLNPTIWHYMSNYGGMCSCLDPFSDEGEDIMKMSEDRFQRFASSVHTYAIGFSHQNMPEYRYEYYEGDREAFLKVMEKTDYVRLGRKRMKEHLDRVLEKPFVDYINTRENPVNGVMNDNRGHGIGFLLYIATAHACAENGYDLYSSSLQSDEAQTMWFGFKEEQWARYDTDGKRMLFIRENIPSLHDASEKLKERKASIRPGM